MKMRKKEKSEILKRKKAQIAIFVLLGLILLIAAMILVYINSAKKVPGVEEVQRVPYQVAPVKNFVDECVDKVALQGLYLIGIQGGYYDLPIKNIRHRYSEPLEFAEITKPYLSSNFGLTFGYVNGENTLPSLNFIENEYSKYMKKTLPICVKNFDMFTEIGYKIKAENVQSNLIINNESVFIKIKYPLLIEFGDSKSFISDFRPLSAPIRLGKLYYIAQEIVEGEIKNPEVINMFYLTSLGIDTSTLVYDDSILIYSLNDIDEDDGFLPYTFMFANEFEKRDTINSTENRPPILFTLPYFRIMKGDEFYYRLSAFDPNFDDLTFFSDNRNFNVDPMSGKINITPHFTGMFEVQFGVKDTNNAQDTQKVIFEIGKENLPPIIEKFSPKILYVGVPFVYRIKANDPENNLPLTYLIQGSLSNINFDPLDGIIRLVPEQNQIGNHELTIYVFDSKGVVSQKKLNLEIKEK